MALSSVPRGILFTEPQFKPLSGDRKTYLNATLVFLKSRSAGPQLQLASVYSNASLTTVLTPPVQADGFGRFPVIYLDPSVTYRVQLYDQYGVKQMDIDPVSPSLFYRSIVKQNTTTISNTASAQADPELQVKLPFAGCYTYEALLAYSTTGSAGNTPGVGVSPVFAKGAFRDFFDSQFIQLGIMDATSIASAAAMNQAGLGSPGPTNYSLTGGGANDYIRVRGVFTTTSPGTLSINWAQQVANATGTSLLPGSMLWVRQLPIRFKEGPLFQGGAGGLNPPILSGAVGSDHASAILTWTVPGSTLGAITGYHVFQDGVLIATTTTPALTVTGLSFDTTYTFNVTAFTAVAESAQSNTVALAMGHPSTIIDIFTTSGTWSKRSFFVSADVYGAAAGGGGASGSAGSHGSGGNQPKDGGGGAGGGGFFSFSITSANLGSTEPVTVGTGGAGGPGLTDISGAGIGGQNGAAGGNTLFGASGASALGGNGGIYDTFSPGAATGGTASVTRIGVTNITLETGGAGSAQQVNGSNPGHNATNAGAGGGSGGGWSGSTAQSGGVGGTNTDPSGFIPSVAGAGGAGRVSNSISAVGNTGIAPGGYGGGGGGGGGMGNSGVAFAGMTGGTGARGGNGVVVVVNHMM